MKCCCFFTCYVLRLRWMSQVWLDVLLFFDFLISERVFLNVLFVCWMFLFLFNFWLFFLYLCLLLVCLHVFESLWFVLLLVNAFMFADVFELRELCGVSWIALHRKCHKHSLDLGENQIVLALLSWKNISFFMIWSGQAIFDSVGVWFYSQNMPVFHFKTPAMWPFQFTPCYSVWIETKTIQKRELKRNDFQ